MKKNLLKALALVAALTMTLSLTACQPKADSAAGTDTEAAADPAKAAELSDEDYAAKVTELYTAIQTDSMAAMENVDQTDTTAVAEATKVMVETVKPYYDELAALKTSGKYKEAQAQIVAGATASAKMLDLSLELITMGLDPKTADSDETKKKVEELQAQAMTFATDAQQLTTGITAVMAGSTDTTAPVEEAAPAE